MVCPFPIWQKSTVRSVHGANRLFDNFDKDKLKDKLDEEKDEGKKKNYPGSSRRSCPDMLKKRRKRTKRHKKQVLSLPDDRFLSDG